MIITFKYASFSDKMVKFSSLKQQHLNFLQQKAYNQQISKFEIQFRHLRLSKFPSVIKSTITYSFVILIFFSQLSMCRHAGLSFLLFLWAGKILCHS